MVVVVLMMLCLAGPRLKAGPHESRFAYNDEAVAADADSNKLASVVEKCMLQVDLQNKWM